MNLFHKSKNAPVPGDVSSDNMNGALPNGGEKPKKPLFTFTKKKEEPASVSSDTLDVDGEKKGENTTERPLIKYRYVVINAMGKKENGTFEAESETEVRNFLLSQDYEVVSIKVRPAYDIDVNDHAKMKVSELSFSLTQLSTYIRSGIPLVDAVKILAKQSTKPAPKKAFQRLVYELLKGESLSNAMIKQKTVFPNLLINMVIYLQKIYQY